MAFDYNKFLKNQEKMQKKVSIEKENSEKSVFLNYERIRTEQSGGNVKNSYFSRKLSF